MTKSPLDYNHKYVEINGYTFHYVDEGNKNGELIILVHGWPELWLTFKNQINYLSNLGYRVVATDLIGIGGSEGPKVTEIMDKEAKGLEKYTTKSNCEALNYLVKKVLKRDQAIFIGHDWGSMVVWRMSQYFPEVVKALASLCVHYSPPSSKYIELDDKIKFVPSLEYQRDIAYKNFESECNQHKELFFEAIFQYNDWKPGTTQNIKDIREGQLRLTDIQALDKFNKSIKLYSPSFTDEEFKYICDQYTPQTIFNSCNYYRVLYLNYLDEKEIKESKFIDKPVLMIHASDDITNFIYKHARKEPPTKKFCRNLTIVNVDGDHWIQLNKKDEVNQAIGEWLKGLKSGNSKL